MAKNHRICLECPIGVYNHGASTLLIALFPPTGFPMTTRHFSQLDRAILGLRSLVMAGNYAGGQRLSEVAMAKQLGISRTPLRQAMDRLIAEGLLERIETGGCRVATFSNNDIKDAIEMRGVIEGTAARLAAERGVDPDLLAQAEDALNQIDHALRQTEGLDIDLYVAQNARFHSLLARFPRSPVVEREIERICLLPLASPSAFLSDQEIIPDFQASLRYAQLQHRAIMDAILGREGARAEALTREHARLALTNFNNLKKRGAMSDVIAFGFK
jgi:GntR family transcriptional regulator of vanillate catabolism